MKNFNERIPVILQSDFYKQAHAEQYPDGTSKLASYATARMSRMEKDELIVFGIQAFVKRWLIKEFNETFFEQPFNEIEDYYKWVIGNTFPLQYVNIEKFRKLHKLGYLPIEVYAIPEGLSVPIRNVYELPEGQCQVPFLCFENTHEDFAWLVEFLESLTSAEIWYPMCVANQAKIYRDIVNHWYNYTGCDMNTAKSAISEFGFRGGKGNEAAILASSAFLTSFNKTATIPAIIYNAEYYNEDITNGKVGAGMISTEHSVMCSNYAMDDDEETFLKKLFTQIYPAGAVSVVMDSYDYWENLKRCGESELKEAIMNRQGTVFFRGDSGDPVDILCGEHVAVYKSIRDRINTRTMGDLLIYAEDEKCWYKYVKGNGNHNWARYAEKPVEVKGTVELLWDMFGGTVNEAGFKVLDSHVRAIYGDSITPVRAQEIYNRLAQKGFASCNVALGAGSFSMNCAETPDHRLAPFTRDSYGIAVKACYAENKNGKKYQVFKNPKTDTGKFKKSQKGVIYVTQNENGEIVAYDGYTSDTLPKEGNLLQLIFKDGEMVKETTLTEVRNRLHNNEF